MSFIFKNKSSTPGGTSPTATSPLTGSPLNSTLNNNNGPQTPTSSNTSTPSSISGLGPLGSSSSLQNLANNQPYTPTITPMYNSGSNSNLQNTSNGQLSNAQSPALLLSSSSSSLTSTSTLSDNITNSSSTNNLNSTIGRTNIIDTSQFNNNYTQFGGQPINPHSEFGSTILNKFSKYLLTKGYNSDGIFRQHPELENEIQNVKKNLLKDLSLDAEQLHIPTLTQNPYVIAELFKQYLALLPEPLFSFHLYDSFLLTHSILSPLDRIWAYRFLLLYLPVGYRGAIRSVLTVLQKVHQNSETTKMDSDSLSKIFSPVFLRPEEQMYYMKSDQQTIEEIVKLWIEEFETISKPPTGPNSRVTTILSTTGISQPHPHQQTQFQQHHPNVQSSHQPPLQSQPTIGLNKISGSNSLSSGNLSPPPQSSKPSPKLSLPTIPKDDHQQVTIVKAKPVIKAIEPNKSSTATVPSTTTTATINESSTSSSNNNNNNSNNNNNNNNSLPTLPSNTQSSSPNINRLSTLIPSSPSSGNISSQEIEEKVNKIKISIDQVVSEQALLQIKNLLKSIEKDFNYNNIIKFSTILRDAKKHMNESTEKLLGLSKMMIREFIQEYPKPLSYNLLVTSQAIADLGALTDQEKKANDLKRASQVAADEICDYIYFFKLNVATFESKEQVIVTAQIFSKLKSILESPGQSINELVNSYQQQNQLNSSNGSPSSSPLLSRFNQNINNSSNGNLNSLINNQISSISNNNIPSAPISDSPSSPSSSQSNNSYLIDKSTARVIEVCVEEIKNKIDYKKQIVENADINQAYEIGKNIRIIKTTLDELYQECKLQPPPEVKAQAVPGEDQLSTLRKALPILFNRFKTQIDCLSQRVLYNQCISNEEQSLITDKLLFINRHLKV